MRRLILMLISGSLAGLTGCRTNAPPDEPDSPPVEWSGDMQAVADGSNRFALNLYAKLREEKGNVFFSPYSAHTALAMTAAGAREVTRDQMVKVLHLPADERKAGASGDLGRFYARPRAEYQLSVANALWGQKGFPWRPDFLDLQRRRFGAKFREADFVVDPEAERKRINGWVQEETRDRIKDLIQEGLITDRHRMVLANAVYFKGAWKDQFDPKATRPCDFTQADGTKTQVPTMHRKGKFRMYVEVRADGRFKPEFQLAELPYKGDELSMVVLLPGKHNGLPALEAKLTPDALTGWLSKAEEAGDADIFLPKFRIETGAVMLKGPLQKLGMVAAFDPSAADFTGLHTGGEQLILDFVVQKAFADVNEEGTEAAAATTVGIVQTSARLGFQAAHPFLFLIRDTRRGTILFMGRVEKP